MSFWFLTGGMKTMAIVFSLSHIAFLRNPGEWNTIVDSTIWIHDALRDLQNFSSKINIYFLKTRGLFLSFFKSTTHELPSSGQGFNLTTKF